MTSPPTQAEIEVTRRIILSLREAGFEIVSVDLIHKISDYFHLNSTPENDLARKYMQALDAIILRRFIPPLSNGERDGT